MNIEIDIHEDIAVARLSGEIDASNSSVMRDKLDELVRDGNTRIVVDLAKVVYLDSSGIGAFISILGRVKKRRGQMKLACLNNNVKELVRVIRLDKIIDIYEGLDEAFASFD